MEDPLTIPGPPPSYALESDSEDEDDYDDGGHPVGGGNSLRPDKDAQVTLEGKVEKGRKCVFLVGEAGEWVAAAAGSGLGEGKVVGKVLLDGEQVASIEETPVATIAYLTTSIPLVSLHPVSSTLLSALGPLKTTIISSYHLPSYIPPSSSASDTTEPSSTILYLSSGGAIPSSSFNKSLRPFTPPNLLHGLPSSLFTLSSLSSLAPTLLLLLPTLSLPPPLNPPFPLTSPSQYSNTSYDAGGPTDLSEFGGVYKSVLAALRDVGKEEGWWVGEGSMMVVAKGGKGGEKGFEWLEGMRKKKRRELVGSMYM